MKFISWNVNGLRACVTKGFLESFKELDADISVGELLQTVEWDYPNFHLTMHCYICSLNSESLHLNEHEASAWLTKETLDSVKWLPADLILLYKISQYI